MALHLDRSRSDALCAWLTANGINPNTVPPNADITVADTDDGRVLRCEVLVLTADGRPVLDDRGDRAAIEIRTVPLVAEPPAWWTPYEKPTREQLLMVVEQVRKLHHPTGVVAAAEHGNPPDCAICGPNVWPCPTIRALDGEEKPDA